METLKDCLIEIVRLAIIAGLFCVSAYGIILGIVNIFKYLI